MHVRKNKCTLKCIFLHVGMYFYWHACWNFDCILTCTHFLYVDMCCRLKNACQHTRECMSTCCFWIRKGGCMLTYEQKYATWNIFDYQLACGVRCGEKFYSTWLQGITAMPGITGMHGIHSRGARTHLHTQWTHMCWHTDTDTDQKYTQVLKLTSRITKPDAFRIYIFAYIYHAASAGVSSSNSGPNQWN